IFALAGEHRPKAIKVRVASAKPAAGLQLDLLGRLGQVFSTPTEAQVTEPPTSGTLGTTTYSLRVREESEKDRIYVRELIDNREPVPSVPTVEPCQQSEAGVPSVPADAKPRLPHITPAGDLVIPFDSPERYHWWKPPHEQRLRVREILAEA